MVDWCANYRLAFHYAVQTGTYFVATAPALREPIVKTRPKIRALFLPFAQYPMLHSKWV